MPSPKGLGTHRRACLPDFATRPVITALASAWLFLLPSAAYAEATVRAVAVDIGCTTADFLAEDVTGKFPGQQTVRLSGARATLFMAAYNQIPPISKLVATELLILFHPRFKVTRIAFFRNGCAVAVATVPIPVVRALLRKTQGASI